MSYKTTQSSLCNKIVNDVTEQRICRTMPTLACGLDQILDTLWFCHSMRKRKAYIDPHEWSEEQENHLQQFCDSFFILGDDLTLLLVTNKMIDSALTGLANGLFLRLSYTEQPSNVFIMNDDETVRYSH